MLIELNSLEIITCGSNQTSIINWLNPATLERQFRISRSSKGDGGTEGGVGGTGGKRRRRSH